MADLTNKKFGRLLVVSRDGHLGASIAWKCLCDCGKEKRVSTSNLNSGATSSCGCIRKQRLGKDNPRTTHGLSNTPTYISWQCMKSRCNNQNHKHYKHYGGKGISYDKAWESFASFLADMGEKPKGFTLDRIDNSKSYSKENCRWASRADQAKNTSTVRNISFNGKTMCMLDWSKELKIPYDQIKNKYHKGLSAAQILGA